MKTRFAPSPTGMLHIGGVRTALFAYLAAEKHNGEFLLRIEDTDRARLVEGSEKQIEESLRWLGIQWAGRPVLQSTRLELYKKYAQKLIDKGLAYADPYTPEEVAAFRQQAKDEKRAFLYRDHRPENPPKWDGSKPLRFMVPEIKRYQWDDVVRGSLSAGEEALDDIVLLKAADKNGDCYPTYNFAHIVDDYDMGITHVIRSEEFISSMPKFLSIYDALEIERPLFVTVPPILGKEGGKKLSKRDGAASALDYKEQGFLPVAVVNFLASMGWNDGTDQEIYDESELKEAFSLDRIQKNPARFDEAKLSWVNWQHVKRMIDDKDPMLASYLRSRNSDFNEETVFDVATLAATKSRDTNDFLDQLTIFYGRVCVPINSVDLSKIGISEQEAEKIIRGALSVIESSSFDSEAIEKSLRDYIETSRYDARSVLMLIRSVLTGKKVSPSIFETIELLGREEATKRLGDSLS